MYLSFWTAFVSTLKYEHIWKNTYIYLMLVAADFFFLGVRSETNLKGLSVNLELDLNFGAQKQLTTYICVMNEGCFKSNVPYFIMLAHDIYGSRC